MGYLIAARFVELLDVDSPLGIREVALISDDKVALFRMFISSPSPFN